MARKRWADRTWWRSPKCETGPQKQRDSVPAFAKAFVSLASFNISKHSCTQRTERDEADISSDKGYKRPDVFVFLTKRDQNTCFFQFAVETSLKMRPQVPTSWTGRTMSDILSVPEEKQNKGRPSARPSKTQAALVRVHLFHSQC